MKVKDATKTLHFRITEVHVAAALSDIETKFDGERVGNHCVIAQAMTDALGDFFVKVDVGSAVTKVFTREGWVIRYETPAVLRSALRTFDDAVKQGKAPTWDLPAGDYYMKPPTGTRRLGGASRIRSLEERKKNTTSSRRSKANKKKHGAKEVNPRRRALPSRTVQPISEKMRKEIERGLKPVKLSKALFDGG